MVDLPSRPDLPDAVTRLVSDLAKLPGVVGVVLGGSRARGEGRADSDTDLGLYYEAPAFTWGAAVEVLMEHDDRRAEGALPGLGAPGDWGPWMNGGAWLRVDGGAVDVLLRDAGFVEGIVRDAVAGRFTSSYQVGHPHGWHSFMLASEVHHNRPLAGDVPRLGALQRATSPYPAALRDAVADRFLFEARFSAMLLAKLASRDDAAHAAGLGYRCAMCLAHVVHAINGAWLVNEKGAIEGTRRLARAPAEFADRARAAMAPSEASQATRTAALAALAVETEAIVRGMGIATSWGAGYFPVGAPG